MHWKKVKDKSPTCSFRVGSTDSTAPMRSLTVSTRRRCSVLVYADAAGLFRSVYSLTCPNVANAILTMQSPEMVCISSLGRFASMWFFTNCRTVPSLKLFSTYAFHEKGSSCPSRFLAKQHASGTSWWHQTSDPYTSTFLRTLHLGSGDCSKYFPRPHSE